MSKERIDGAPRVAGNLSVFDCSGVADGGAAAIIVRAEDARRYTDKPMYLKGMSLQAGRCDGVVTAGRHHVSFPEVVTCAAEAYAHAGIKNPRTEISMAEVHDCFTPTELLLMEDLGFSERGQAWKDVLDGAFDLKGRLPVNPDGGLKSFGHPVGASGLRMMFELWLQFRGEAGARQLPDPRIGLAHNMGGLPGRVRLLHRIVRQGAWLMTVRAVRRVLVVGSGLMGAGIAQVAATSGFQADLVDAQQGALDQARERIISSLSRLERAGKLKDAPESILARITFGLDLERAARNADLVIEAIVEALEPKQTLFAKLGDWCPKDVVLATNTSQFRIGQIAEPCKSPERVIGMHWSNPPPLMMLVEIIISSATSNDVLEATLGFVKSCDRSSVVCRKDVPGFISNRMSTVLFMEAARTRG